jgi:hypothetical protein
MGNITIEIINKNTINHKWAGEIPPAYSDQFEKSVKYFLKNIN